MILRVVLKVIVNVLSVLLMIVGRHEGFASLVFDFFQLKFRHEGGTINKQVFDRYMFISVSVAVLIIYAYYPIRFELLKRKRKRDLNKLKSQAKELRTIFSKSLGRELKMYDLRLNIRFFTPRPFYYKSFKDWFKYKKKYFVVNHFDNLTDDGTDDKFCFQVFPIPRGLVGLAYQAGEVRFDDKLKERKELFNLNNKHLNTGVIANTDFAIAKPIVKNNGKVSAILTFDTAQDVTIPKNKKEDLKDLILFHSRLFENILINLN